MNVKLVLVIGEVSGKLRDSKLFMYLRFLCLIHRCLTLTGDYRAAIDLEHDIIIDFWLCASRGIRPGLLLFTLSHRVFTPVDLLLINVRVIANGWFATFIDSIEATG